MPNGSARDRTGLATPWQFWRMALASTRSSCCDGSDVRRPGSSTRRSG